jgi:hypothetical protein
VGKIRDTSGPRTRMMVADAHAVGTLHLLGQNVVQREISLQRRHISSIDTIRCNADVTFAPHVL